MTAAARRPLWVTWTAKGRDPYTNPRAARAHLAAQGAGRGDLRNGGFPLACGRWAPEGWDADIVESSAPRCRRCLKAQAAAPASAVRSCPCCDGAGCADCDGTGERHRTRLDAGGGLTLSVSGSAPLSGRSAEALKAVAHAAAAQFRKPPGLGGEGGLRP